jgi:hypothetical protein
MTQVPFLLLSVRPPNTYTYADACVSTRGASVSRPRAILGALDVARLPERQRPDAVVDSVADLLPWL